MRKVFKKVFKNAGRVLLGGILILLLLKIWADRTYFNTYDPDLPFNTRIIAREAIDDTIDLFGLTRPCRFEREAFVIDVRPNEPMPAVLTLPLERDGKVPVIIFVHGAGMDKSFVEQVGTPFNEAGFAMASFDLAFVGERAIEGGPLRNAYAFRQLPWKVVNDTRRLMDYLQTHPDIDGDRIYLGEYRDRLRISAVIDIIGAL